MMLPWWAWVAIGYFVMSVITFVLFGIDKRRAVRGLWRVPESTLHVCELLGGWPGGLIARSVFHHKRKKVRFIVVSTAIAAIHLVGWAAVLWLPN